MYALYFFFAYYLFLLPYLMAGPILVALALVGMKQIFSPYVVRRTTLGQRGILCLGGFTIMVMSLFPPWLVRGSHPLPDRVRAAATTRITLHEGSPQAKRSAGYAPYFWPMMQIDWRMGPSYGRVRDPRIFLNTPRLLLQIAIAALLTAALFFACRDKRVARKREDEASDQEWDWEDSDVRARRQWLGAQRWRRKNDPPP